MSNQKVEQTRLAQAAGVPVMPVRKLTVERPEVGERVLVETPAGQTTATWLGVISSPRELFQAMQLAAGLEAEREEGEQR